MRHRDAVGDHVVRAVPEVCRHGGRDGDRRVQQRAPDERTGDWHKRTRPRRRHFAGDVVKRGDPCTAKARSQLQRHRGRPRGMQVQHIVVARTHQSKRPRRCPGHIELRSTKLVRPRTSTANHWKGSKTSVRAWRHHFDRMSERLQRFAESENMASHSAESRHAVWAHLGDTKRRRFHATF